MSNFPFLTKLFASVGLLMVFAFAQAAIPAVPPEIMAQMKNMSGRTESTGEAKWV